MWKDYVEGITATTSSTQIWRTIRSIDGRRPPSKDNEVLEVNRTYVEDGGKAKERNRQDVQGFFSSLSVQKEDRKLRHKNRRRKKRSGAPEESQKAFTMAEMQLVIKDSKNNRASGEDDIPYEFIKHSWTESQRTH